MNSRELRVGNYVEWEDDSKDVVIIKGIVKPKKLGIWFVDIKYPNKKKKYSASINEFKGIELTEEWMLKFGFEYSENDNFYCLNIHGKPDLRIRDYTSINSGFKVGYWWNYKQFRYITDIKHVHQLQNLYFALTNEEFKKINKL